MISLETIAAAAVMFVTGLIYSSVGFGGATGYIAIMMLIGIPPREIAPVALGLNVLVAGLAFYQFRRAGKFRANLALPILVVSIPAAFLGGFARVESRELSVLVGIVLFTVAILMFLQSRRDLDETTRLLPRPFAGGVGAVIGAISGMVGIGGGVFLSPMLIFGKWATAAEAAGVASVFILLNSLAGLGGRMVAGTMSFGEAWIYAPFALAGGWIGSRQGSGRFSSLTMRRVLAIVLILAAGKAFIF